MAINITISQEKELVSMPQFEPQSYDTKCVDDDFINFTGGIGSDELSGNPVWEMSVVSGERLTITPCFAFKEAIYSLSGLVVTPRDFNLSANDAKRIYRSCIKFSQRLKSVIPDAIVDVTLENVVVSS